MVVIATVVILVVVFTNTSDSCNGCGTGISNGHTATNSSGRSGGGINDSGDNCGGVHSR